MDLSLHAPVLLRQTDYRAFLREALLILGQRSGRINYAAFSRKAGFASRSFPRDVIVGKRRMTLAALPKFVRGLNLRGDLRIYFQTLVFLEESDLNQNGSSKKELEAKLAKIRANAESLKHLKPASGALVVRYRRWQEIFAALGETEVGASLSEIESRTRYSQAVCIEALSEMTKEGLVHHNPETQCFRAVKWHLNLEGLGRDQYFKQHMKYRMNQASLALETKLNSDEHLFFNSVWSIEKSRLPEFKAELRSLLLQFVENTEKSTGDELNQILVCMGRF